MNSQSISANTAKRYLIIGKCDSLDVSKHAVSHDCQLRLVNNKYKVYSDLITSCKLNIVLYQRDIDSCLDIASEAEDRLADLKWGQAHITADEFCYTKLAVLLKDISLCNKITTSDGKCEYEYALGNLDMTSCPEDIKNYFAGGGSDTQPIYGFCQYCVAFKSNDSSLCEQISIQEKKDACYYDFALKQRNTTICDNAGTRKIQCYEDVPDHSILRPSFSSC